jgi:signal recognition particle receptor subunit beta
VVQINFAAKEINCKIVYYGPGLSGKTTNLEMIHTKIPGERRGELTSIATEGDRTLFFDFMPIDLGKIGGMETRFHLYTVPGQVYYNATRKLVLQGVDGVIFVADSQQGKMQENLESLRNLEENLKEYGIELSSIPFVIQYNKRDLPGVMSVEEMNRVLNTYNVPVFEAVAITGEGVFPTLKKCAEAVLQNLQKRYADRLAPAAAAERVPQYVATPPEDKRPLPPKRVPVPPAPNVAGAPVPPPPVPAPAPTPVKPPVGTPKPVTAPASVVTEVEVQAEPVMASEGLPAVKKVSAQEAARKKISSRIEIPEEKPAPAAVVPPAPKPSPPQVVKKGVSPVLLIIMLVLGFVIGLAVEHFVGILKGLLGGK